MGEKVYICGRRYGKTKKMAEIDEIRENIRIYEHLIEEAALYGLDEDVKLWARKLREAYLKLGDLDE